MSHINRRVCIHLRGVALVLLGSLLALCSPGSAVAAPPSSRAGDVDSMVRAEAKREVGAHAEAAALFAQAYRELPRAQQTSLMGEILVRNATADYQLALESLMTDDERFRLVTEELELLREFAGARAAESVPPDLARARSDVELQAEGLGRSRMELVMPEPPRQEQAREEDQEPPVAASEDQVEDDVTRAIEREPVPEPRSRAGAALISVGAASVIGGAAMIAGGGWMLRETSLRRNAYVAAANAVIASAELEPGRYDADQAMVDGLGESITSFERQSRTNAIALTVVGGVLAGSGVGLVTWGIIRARRAREPSRVALVPAVGRRHAGIHLSMAF